MADVTISQLTGGVPSGNNLLPYSTGSNTLGVPVSAIFQNTGKVGIGTTNPVCNLHVNNSGNSSGILSLSPAAAGGGGTSFILMGNRDSGGVAGPAIIASGNRLLRFGVGDSFTDQLGGTFTEFVRIDSSGNVGIGTSSPSAKLDVNGDIKSINTPKAYGIFNGSNAINTNCTILKSYNISKIEKMSEIGFYKITFINSVNWPYVPMVTGFNSGTGDGGWVAVGHGNGGYSYDTDPTSTEFNILAYTYNGNFQSQKYISFVVF